MYEMRTSPRLLLFLFIVMLIASCGKENIDPEQAEAFVKFFGNSSQDEGADLRQMPDGGYVFVGSTTRTSGDMDIVLVKTDRFGNQEWFRYFGDKGDEQGNCVQLTPDGGLVLLGTTEDTLSGEKNILIVKTAPGTDGEIQWTRVIDRPGNQKGSYLQVLQDGYILTGNTDENGDLDILVIRTRSDGSIAGDATSWYVVGGYNGLTGNGLDDEGFYVGESADGYGFIVVGAANTGSGITGRDVIVVSMSANGVGWSNIIFHGTGNDAGKSFVHVSDNDYLVVGTGQSAQMQTGIIQGVTIDREYITLSGSGFTQVSYEGKSLELNDVCITSSGRIALAGSLLSSSGNRDIFMAFTGGQGQPILGTPSLIGGSGNEYANRIIATSDDGFALIGSTGIPEDNNRMIALVKLNREGSLRD